MPKKIIILLIAIIACSWAYLVYQAWQMNHLPMAQMWMPPAILTAWTAGDFVWVFSMWAVMMAAMMLPSTLPMLTAFSRHCQRDNDANATRIIWFGSGYLSVWLAFSIVLTIIQWLFHGLAWLSPMMENRQPLLSALILLTAGAYQFTAFKDMCLSHCRSPFGFLLNHWRPGNQGALQIGLKHGLTCLGCCWAQMLIMFAIGVMSLPGMLLITLLVIIEKWASFDPNKLSHVIGLSFLLWGVFSLLALI
ncbi:DUF2182 domain-containing protein [Methylomonas sp. MgM2]